MLRRKTDPEDFLKAIARFQNLPPDQASQDFKDVFLGSEQGRRVLNQILSWSGVLRSSFRKEAGQMAYREGERNIGLRILAQVYGDKPDHPDRGTKR